VTARRRRRLITLLVVIGLAVVVVRFGNDAMIALETQRPSHSEGTPSHGRLVNGRRLPTSGPNFRAYSYLGTLLGRNSVHGRVRDAVLDAYARMRREHPDRVFVYGETGWPGGGRIRPHRTHQNGSSVDFFVPVIDASGRSVELPTGLFRRFGYSHEFDANGREGNLRIDFASMAAHLGALDDAARAHALRIDRVIFAPELQPLLFGTPRGGELRARVPFVAWRAWVRHDEHYHVDFDLNSR